MHFMATLILSFTRIVHCGYQYMCIDTQHYPISIIDIRKRMSPEYALKSVSHCIFISLPEIGVCSVRN